MPESGGVSALAVAAGAWTTLWAEGDSYMAGNLGPLLPLVVQQVNLLNTALSGSSISAIQARVFSRPGLIKAGYFPVIWDGSATDYGSVSAYLAHIDQILSITGGSRLLFLPPVNVGPSASPTPTQLTLDLQAIEAGLVSRGVPTFDPVPVINVLSNGGAQDVQDIAAGVVVTSALQDAVHPNAAAFQLVANRCVTTINGFKP